MDSPLPGIDLYQPTSFRPIYTPFQGERWEIRIAPMLLCRGYWSPPQMITDMAALMRRQSNGDVISWMSMTPFEIESQELGCWGATGHTVVMGLGMGWCAANAAINPAVTKVTVVEFDPEIIDAVTQSKVFEQLPPDALQKISIINGDAYNYKPEPPADTLLADIWLGIFGPERDEEVRRMHANTGASRVYYWGQELNFVDRAQRRGLPLTAATIAALVAETGLPLIGPERSDYPELVNAAASWLNATPVV